MRFIVIPGEAHFTLDGNEGAARQGETVIVPPGMRHSEGTPGPGEFMLWSNSGQPTLVSAD